MPAVTVVRRGKGWCARFRLPKHIADRYSLPIQCRMSTALAESAPPSRVDAERRRIEALLDLVVRGHSQLDGSSLAAYLGLPDTGKKRHRSNAARTQGRLWPDLVKAYEAEYRSRTLSREKNEGITLGRLKRLAAAFPDKAPDSLTPKMWTEWLDSLDTGAEGRNRLRSLAGRAYRWGMSKYTCERNPIDAVATFKPPRTSVRRAYMTQKMINDELARRDYTEQEEAELRRWRVLDEAEQREFVALVRERDAEFLPCVILGLHGVSGIDIRSAKKDAYDIRTGIFTGRRTKRGAAPFAVPISQAFKPDMDRYVMALPERSMMFPWLDGVTDRKQKYLRRWWKLIEGTTFEGLRAHSLRHSFISTLLARQVPVETIAKFVGHLETRTTVEVYGAFMPDRSVELMSKLRLFEAG